MAARGCPTNCAANCGCCRVRSPLPWMASAAELIREFARAPAAQSRHLAGFRRCVVVADPGDGFCAVAVRDRTIRLVADDCRQERGAGATQRADRAVVENP